MHISKTACRSERGFDSIAQIDSNDIFCTPARCQLRVPAFAATAFKHNLVAEELRSDRGDPTQELLGIARIFLSEVLPLPAKAGSCRCFITLYFFWVGETRYA